MARKDDHSVSREPHLHDVKSNRDHSVVGEPAIGYGSQPDGEFDRIRSNVWDDPATQWTAHTRPEHLEDYAQWYRRREHFTGWMTSWLAIAAIAVLGGPLAVFGAMVTNGAQNASPLIGVILFAPLVEELLKIGLVVIVLETRPYLFKTGAQLMITVLLSALVFAILENILYLNVYVDDPSESLIRWRWTVCTALHIGATTIAGMGVMRMWRRSRLDWSPPKIRYGYPYFVTAMAVHGAYNFFAVLYSAVFEPF